MVCVRHRCICYCLFLLAKLFHLSAPGHILCCYFTFLVTTEQFATIKCPLGHCRRGVVVITAAQLHSTKPELSLCTGSKPPRDVSEIRDGKDLCR